MSDKSTSDNFISDEDIFGRKKQSAKKQKESVELEQQLSRV